MFTKFLSILANSIPYSVYLYWIWVGISLAWPILMEARLQIKKRTQFSKRNLWTNRIIAAVYISYTLILPIIGLLLLFRLLTNPDAQEYAASDLELAISFLYKGLIPCALAVWHFSAICSNEIIEDKLDDLFTHTSRNIVVFVVLFIKTLLLFILSGFALLSDSRMIWYPQYHLEKVAIELSVDGGPPTSRRELLRRSSTMKSIENYGRWCYFYDAQDNNFLLVAEYSRLWFVYSREGELVRTYEPNEQWREVINRCKRERWF